MKKLILPLFITISANLAFAKTITVNNNTNAIGMYTNLQTAVDAALINDTVLVSASPDTYGPVTITKKIYLIGEGYLSSTDAKAKLTTVDKITIDTIPGGAKVSGLVIEGFFGSYISQIGTPIGFINNVVIKNCTGYLYVKGNDWEIINCNLGVVISQAPSGKTITNISAYNSVVAYFSGFKGGLISNCIIKSGGSEINSCSFMQVQNCIFTFSGAAGIGSDNIALINCSFVGQPTIDATQSNTATNCKFKQDPNFINIIDYQLNPKTAVGANNPLLKAGTDGTDIGITGGTYPIKILDGRGNLPQVYQSVVKTGVIAPGDVLKIDVIARTRK